MESGKILKIYLSRKKIIVFIILIFLSVNFQLYSAEKMILQTVLSQQLQQGKIDKVESLSYQLLAVYNPEQLPTTFQEFVPVFTRNTTALKAEIFKMWPQLSTPQKETLDQYFTRPYDTKLPLSRTSPNGLFKIHYTSEGPDAATEEYINNVAAIFDHVYDVEINDMGYSPPPVDDPESPEYDVYVHNIGDYGATTPENPVPGTIRDDYTSWVEIDNDFQHTPTKGIEALKVTAAHEFYHMIQLGYRTFQNTSINSVFLFEACAAWMEDFVYDDVNDYYFYLTSFFRSPDKPFHIVNGSHEYGLAIYFHMLEKKYGSEIIKLIWNEFINNEPFEAIDRALIDYSSNFTTELAEFAVWNYFTGARADSVEFYPEGQYYPEIEEKQSFEVNNSLVFTSETNQLGFNYYNITVKTTGDFVVKPSFPDPQDWIYSVIIDPFDGQPYYTYCGGNSSKNLGNIGSLGHIIVSPVYAQIPVSDSYSSNVEFSIKLERGSTPKYESEIVSVFPNPFIPSEHQKTSILFRLTYQHDDVYISIFTEHGNPINRIRLGKRPDGLNSFEWDGTDFNGESVISGIYLFVIEASEILQGGKIAVIN